ncbi:MAG: multidrug effflux MFS transporter [Magnetococcales bacterium]|nr:multidrug effflux MFS transporter [Magnetococcales bacterium]
MNLKFFAPTKHKEKTIPKLSQIEFVVLMAMMISLVAMSIDSMLPALEQIGNDLGSTHPNDNQLVIAALFFGFAVGQLFFGPLSDSTGRKPAIVIGLILFSIGCIQSYLAQDFNSMLIGRFVQGLGVASPRTVSSALIRDLYSGANMARMMSLIMSVFVLVPVIAPAVGQGIIAISNWRMIFAILLLMALVVLVWFKQRQPETLAKNRQHPFSTKRIAVVFKVTCLNRITIGYTVISGLVFGAFSGYLISSQQILQIQYKLGDQFPIYFGGLALCIGAATLTNSRLVMRFGMYHLTTIALYTKTLISIGFLIYMYTSSGSLSFVGLMIWGGTSFFCVGILFGNTNSLAMEPMGHQAGVAASVVGAISSFLAIILGTTIGQLYNGDVIPLISGFAILGTLSIVIAHWSEKGRINQDLAFIATHRQLPNLRIRDKK